MRIIAFWNVFRDGVWLGRVRAAWGEDADPIDRKVPGVQSLLVTELVAEEGNKKVYRVVA